MTTITVITEIRSIAMPMNLLTALLLSVAYFLVRRVHSYTSLLKARYLGRIAMGWFLNSAYLMMELARNWNIFLEYQLGIQTSIIALSTVSSALFLDGSLCLLTNRGRNRRLFYITYAPAALLLCASVASIYRAQYLVYTLFPSVIYDIICLGAFFAATNILANKHKGRSFSIKLLLPLPILFYATLQLAYLAHWSTAQDNPSTEGIGAEVILTVGFTTAFALKLAHLVGVALLFNLELRELINIETDHQNTSHQENLLSQMVHELGTPAASLSLQLENLESHARKKPDVRAIVREIGSTINLISSIVYGAHEVINPKDKGILHSHFEDCNINNLLQASVFSVRSLYDKKRNGKVSVVPLLCKNPILSCQAPAIRQVFSNILKNSFEAIGEDGGEIRVITRRERGTQPSPDISISVTIRDTGEGIAAEHLPLVTKNKFTTKQGAGRGHGLFIVDNIVRHHGGRMDIASDSGSGTLVRLNFSPKFNTTAHKTS